MRPSYQSLKSCIELCWECRTVCLETLYNHCLVRGGDHATPLHVKLMTDCIQICQTAADFMVRGSGQHASVCATCARICEACAQSCEQFGSREMERCADLCRQCAQSCHDMSRERQAA